MMRVYFSKHIKNYKVFELIKELLINSFLDLGHSISKKDDADIIISMYRHPDNVTIEKDQKFIFLQTEPYKINKKSKKELGDVDYPFSRYKADVYWGFDKHDKNESYLVLGYHPCLDFSSELEQVTPIYPIGFVGSKTPRRKTFFNSLTADVRYCKGWIRDGEGWKTKETMQMYKECKINIHVNAWDKRESLTPWDRITRFLHNRCFFIMEDVCDCPINQIVRFDLSTGEETIQKYINNDKLRQEIAEECYNVYKRDFDMRSILEEKLKEII